MNHDESKEIQESVTRNTAVMSGAQVITWASSFVLLLFLPKYLGSDAYGKLFLALSIAMIAEVLIGFGGSYLIPKEISREKSKTAQILTNFGVFRALLWVLAMIILVAFSYLAGYPPVTRLLIVILGFSKLWSALKAVLVSAFQGHERMEYPSIGNIVERVFISAAIVGALLMGAGPVTVAIIMAGGILLNLLVLLGFSKKIVKVFPKVDWNNTFSMISVSIPYFLWSLFSIIYYRVDAIMLSLFTDDTVVGWYGAAYRFFDIVMVFPSIFTTVIFPIFTRLWIDKKDHFLVTFQKSLKFMVIISIPVSVMIFFYSKNIVDLFFGLQGYEPSVWVLQIFALSILLVYVDFILGSTILAADKQKKWAVVGFIAIFVNVFINYFFIPFAQSTFGNGGLGAAAATFITEGFILVSALMLLPKDYVRSINFKYLPGLLLAAGVMFMIILAGDQVNLPWVISALLSSIIYVLGVLFFGVLEEKEREFILGYISPAALKKYITKKSETIV